MVFYDLKPRTVEVRSTEDLSASLRRVVFTSPDIAGFMFTTMAPDDHVKLFFPDPATGDLLMPEARPGWQRRDDGRALTYRDYTVRAFDAESGELTIDFVTHLHGVGGAWAARAQPGDRLGMLGPRGSHIHPNGYDWYLLGADETALPALARWLEELPADKRVIGVVEVAGPQDEVELPARAGAEIRVVHRGGSTGSGVVSAMEEAVRGIALPDGEFYAWVAGEADTLKPIRRYLRRELGLPTDRVKVDGYWRRGTVNLDHHAEDEAGDI